MWDTEHHDLYQVEGILSKTFIYDVYQIKVTE